MSVCFLSVFFGLLLLLDLQWKRENIHLLCVFQEVFRDSVIPLEHIFCSFVNLRFSFFVPSCSSAEAKKRGRQVLNIFNCVCFFIKVSMPALQLLPHGSISMDSIVWREHTLCVYNILYIHMCTVYICVLHSMDMEGTH